MTKKLFTLYVGMVFAASVAWAAPQAADEVKLPILQPGIQLMNGDKPLTVGSAPEIVDWNNDGKKDLLVGIFAGRVHLFLNKGTDAQPVFDGSETLKAAGEIIKVGSG